MGTINELNTTDTLADEDKLVLWKTQAGATRAITAIDAAAYFVGGAYQPLDEMLTSIAATGPTSAAGQMFYTTAQDTVALANYSTIRGFIGAQPLDATLTAIAGLTIADGDFLQGTGPDSFRVRKVTVGTYAALTAIAAADRFDDMLVYVASRTTDGDGGEGYWRFDAASSATANGGTILAPDAGSGRWIRQGLRDGKLCLRWFGTDATALQAAFDYMETDSSISTLFIANGTYTIASTCTYSQTTLGRSITIEGEDMLETILSYTGSATNGMLAFVLGTAANQRANRLVIRNMAMTTAVANAGAAIKSTRTASATVAPNALFEDIYFYQTGGGYWTYDIWSIDASDQWFNRLYGMNFGSDTTACVFFNNNLTTQVVFGAYFHQCSFNGADYNIRSTGQLESIYFTDCSLVGAQDCISLDATSTTFGNPHLTIKGCHINAKRRSIDTTKWRAVMITGTDVYSGVGVDDEAGSNLRVVDADHVTVTGNKFEIGAVALSRSFISFSNVKDFSITGNVMHNATNVGVTISGTSGRGVVSGNTIEGYTAIARQGAAIYAIGSGGLMSFTGNKMSYFTNGIELNSNDNIVSGNVFSDMATGVVVLGGVNNRANGNVFSGVADEYSGTLSREIYRTATVDPGSVPAGARATETVTIAGAKLGDFIQVAAPYDITDLHITAAVINTNGVAIYIKNDTGGAIDLASGTWNFRLSS